MGREPISHVLPGSPGSDGVVTPLCLGSRGVPRPGVVGGGTADGRGAVLQYGSQDLDHWQYRGVLCGGRAGTDDDARRQVWECPQMVEIGGVWALVVSVGLDDRAGYVAASVGRYDGAR